MTLTPPPAAATPTDDAGHAFDYIDELEDLLDIGREQWPELPAWEFCDGFLTALVCTRRPVPPAEALPLLFGLGEADPDWARAYTAEQSARFETLWQQRWQQVAQALDRLDVEDLSDDAAFQPMVQDMRALLAQARSEQDAAAPADDAEAEGLPSFGQVWALGFMTVVSLWADEWQLPSKDKESAELIEQALAIVHELTADDPGPYTFSGLGEGQPGGMSEDRLELFGETVWACYDLRALWKRLGPRILTVRKSPQPGRNEPCPCGSGKKYKQCHGR
jgi:uncharacterized protein